MKVLFIGGTGNISASVSRLCIEKEIDLYLFNRGKTNNDIPGAKLLTGDIHQMPAAKNTLKDHHWDVVVNWIAYTVQDVEIDIELFSRKTKQYIFISSASAYQKPLLHPVITESTPLKNPFWEYSRNKIACEERLMLEYRTKDFPATIVRPSHTYDKAFPFALGGWSEYTLIERMRQGKKMIIHGDGSSLWVVTHSEDFARGFTGLLGHQQSIGHAFHITSDELLNWDQIHQTIAEAAGTSINAVHIPSEFICKFDDFQVGNLMGDKTYSVLFDNSKIKSFVPSFKAVIPFKEGIKRTIDWFEKNPQKKVINDKTNQLMDKIIEAWEKRQ